jgi:hypothetical protein
MTARHVLRLPVVRVVRDTDDGWLVILPNGHSWWFATRIEALLERDRIDLDCARRL